MSLEDQIVQSIIDGAGENNCTLNLHNDQCLSFAGQGAPQYVNSVEANTRFFLKAHTFAHVQRRLLGADSANTPSCYYCFPYLWLPLAMRQVYIAQTNNAPDTWHGIDGNVR